jgi:hypothetical protein
MRSALQSGAASAMVPSPTSCRSLASASTCTPESLASCAVLAAGPESQPSSTLATRKRLLLLTARQFLQVHTIARLERRGFLRKARLKRWAGSAIPVDLPEAPNGQCGARMTDNVIPRRARPRPTPPRPHVAFDSCVARPGISGGADQTRVGVGRTGRAIRCNPQLDKRPPRTPSAGRCRPSAPDIVSRIAPSARRSRPPGHKRHRLCASFDRRGSRCRRRRRIRIPRSAPLLPRKRIFVGTSPNPLPALDGKVVCGAGEPTSDTSTWKPRLNDAQ